MWTKFLPNLHCTNFKSITAHGKMCCCNINFPWDFMRPGTTIFFCVHKLWILSLLHVCTTCDFCCCYIHVAATCPCNMIVFLCNIILKQNVLLYFHVTEETYSYGSHDTGDPSTTNLYIGNINPAVRKYICIYCCLFHMFYCVVAMCSWHESRT